MPPTARELADRWLDGQPVPCSSLPNDTAVAWALKDACYSAWNTEPARVARVADALDRWHLQCTHAHPAPATEPIAALAAWTRGIAELTRAHMADALSALASARQAFDQLGDSASAAQTQVPMIVALSMLGRHDDAVACAEAALATFVSHGDWMAASKVSLNLGSLHLRHDAYARAAAHYRDAARYFAKAGDHEHSVMADIGLADALTAQGDLSEAERMYARARMRAQAHGLPVLEAVVDESQALLDLVRGRYGEALAGFERCRARYASLDMPQHLAIAEKQLADAYLELRMLPEAEHLYLAALTQLESFDMPDEQAWTRVQLGRLQVLKGDDQRAREQLDAAGAIFDRQGSDAGAATVALARSEQAARLGDAIESLAQAHRALLLYQQAGANDAAMRAQLAHARAQALAGALVLARDAFAELLAVTHHGHRHALEVAALAGLALAEQALQHHETARRHMQEAVALYENLRAALPGDDLRHAFAADHRRLYRELLAYALHDHADDPSPHHATNVLVAADRLQSRTLSERLAGPGSFELAPDDETESRRSRVSWLTRRVQGLEDEDTAPSPALQEELAQAEAALLEHVRRRRLAAAMRPGVEPGILDTERLVGTISPGECLVEYAVSGDELIACVVGPFGVRLHRHVASWPEVLRATEAARFQLDALSHGAPVMSMHMPTLAARCLARLSRLHELLVAPIAQALKGSTRLTLVAPAPLSALPWAAFGDEHGSLLGDRLELAWVPSADARVTLGRSQGIGSAGPVLVMGESSHLPHAAHEAEIVARCYPDVRLLLNADATVDAFKSHIRAAGVVHLACHAIFRSDSPRFSALHLHDGAVTAELVESMRLRAEVVVLSACETSGAQAGAGSAQGDEWIGLVRAFLGVGARNVVASLWRVDDAVTAAFMRHLHLALASGATPGTAVRLAQTSVRLDHPHPFHWAAFAWFGAG